MPWPGAACATGHFRKRHGRKNVAEECRAFDGGDNGRVVTPLGGFLLLYAMMYSAFGASSPFLPSWVDARGIQPEHIGMLFAAGTAIRLVSAPMAGRLADRFRALALIVAIRAVRQ